MLFHMPSTKISRASFVLAGGKSSRMGSDKAFLKFGGQTLLQRAISVAATVSDRVLIVGDPEKFAQYGATVKDLFAGCGPLGGIHAALVSSNADLNLVLAVDMPFVSSGLLAFLFASAEDAKALITVPRAGNGLQPLCAIYRREFAADAETALRAGKYKIDALFSGLPIHLIDESTLAAAGFSAQTFFNVNTPNDRLAADAESL
jgi:molybdopterin-guanine dinucleotide biosynthesis protein A